MAKVLHISTGVLNNSGDYASSQAEAVKEKDIVSEVSKVTTPTAARKQTEEQKEPINQEKWLQ